MTIPLSRSSDEAHLYMELHPCPCGESDFGRVSSVAEVHGEWRVRYTGRCVECGRERAFEFRQPEHLTEPEDGAWAAGDAPSELLDAGEWLFVADTYGSVPTDRTELSDSGRDQLRTDLRAAAAALDEVLKFLPDGVDVLPEAACWSDRGRQVRDAEPGRLRRFRVTAARDTYRALLADLDR
ncbi:MAG: hypothetical protein WCA46_01015 [Actinocatenispora sp.]